MGFSPAILKESLKDIFIALQLLRYSLIRMQLSCFQIKSRFFSYFLGLRKRPGAVFGIFLTVVIVAISLTIFVSTVFYWNSVKKTRIQSQGKIRKIARRPAP